MDMTPQIQQALLVAAHHYDKKRKNLETRVWNKHRDRKVSWGAPGGIVMQKTAAKIADVDMEKCAVSPGRATDLLSRLFPGGVILSDDALRGILRKYPRLSRRSASGMQRDGNTVTYLSPRHLIGKDLQHADNAAYLSTLANPKARFDIDNFNLSALAKGGGRSTVSPAYMKREVLRSSGEDTPYVRVIQKVLEK